MRTPESETISKGKMNKEQTGILALLWKVNQFAMPFLIAFCVWVVRESYAQDKRITSVEDWRVMHNTFAEDSLKTIARERDEADARSRESILREVERAASAHREAITAQLAAMQRDLIRIAVTLEMQRLRDPALLKPSAGLRAETDTLDILK